MGNDTVNFVQLGINFKRNGEYEQSLNCYNRALMIDPSNLKAHYAKGKLEFIMGAYKEAQVSYYYAASLAADYIDFDLLANGYRSTDCNEIELHAAMRGNIFHIRDNISRHIGYARIAYQFKENFADFEYRTKLELRQILDNYRNTIDPHFIKPNITVSSDVFDYYELLAQKDGLTFLKIVSENQNDTKLMTAINSVFNLE